MTRPNPLKGGKGDKHSLEDFDPKEVAMGIKVESEHSDDEDIVKDIVIDHLTENPHYYSKLKEAGLADELKEAILEDLKNIRVPLLMPSDIRRKKSLEKAKRSIEAASLTLRDFKKAQETTGKSRPKKVEDAMLDIAAITK